MSSGAKRQCDRALHAPREFAPPQLEQHWSEKGVSLAQNTQGGPCIPVGMQLRKAGVGPTSGPTRRLPHLQVGAAGCRGHLRPAQRLVSKLRKLNIAKKSARRVPGAHRVRPAGEVVASAILLLALEA